MQDVTIPQWFLVVQGAFTPLITLAVAGALKLLWSMRDELTAIRVKVDLSQQLHYEVNELRTALRRLEREFDRTAGQKGNNSIVEASNV